MPRTAPISRTTVVVATRNRRRQLLRYLPRHEGPVILVDNASDDGTPDMVRTQFPEIALIQLDENIGAAARTIGAAAAETPYVAFADDDSYWADGALERVATLFDEFSRAALLTGRVLVGEQQRVDPISDEMAAAPLGTEPDLPGPTVLGFLACAAAVRRDVFLAAGGFEPKLHVYGEEALLAMDLAADGWGLAYVPSLVVHHLPEPGGRDGRARQRRQARNDLLTAWLRRPASVGVRTAIRHLRGPNERAGLIDALGELPWVRRNRRIVPAKLEAALRTLEGGGPALRPAALASPAIPES